MKVLALVTDAFGGYGGIAQYNRHFLTALCESGRYQEVVAMPRLISQPEERLPARLTWLLTGLGGKFRYFLALLFLLARVRNFDAIYCGHINLVPVAIVAKWLTGAPLILQIHGIDAWRPSRSALTNRLVARVDLCLAVSRVTRRRFLSWANLDPHRCRVLPNTIASGVFSPGPRNPALVERYGLYGKRVLMTFGRLESEERYKGFDEVLVALPSLKDEFPDLVYLIAGDGDDRERLQQKAHDLGVADRVVFTGPVAEPEKADHYRLADVYAMPSRGEGFGIVLLEALATGLPVIASGEDGGRDALRDGSYGMLIAPDDTQALLAAIRRLLSARPPAQVPTAFSYANFSRAVDNAFRTGIPST